MKDLRGKTAFITGAASGVGYGMAHAFLGEGMQVVIADIRGDALEKTKQQLQAVSDSVHGIQVDITDREAMAAAADETEAHFGKVHMLCNNAGINVFGPIEQANYDDWDWIMDVNLNAVFTGIKCFLPKIQAHGEGGHIVNTASMAAFVSGPGAGIYTAAKCAVRGLTECLWYGLIQQGIGVSLVCPGLVASNINMSEELRPESRADTGYLPDQEWIERLAVVQKMGMDPLEIGQKILQGILKDELYILTHPDHREEIERDFAEVMAAIPDGPVPSDRQKVEEGRRAMKYEIKDRYMTRSAG
ncbi:MAG: SDR family NAD(P)-dependent oxidoreductase [Woeseiaceae bacterium]|nr:SDR family NAD(P)-dependent oxidoreductase [Woeseiaceae bacterium]